MKILDFLQAENIPFQKLSLYKEAFTHASYANEAHHYNKDYERLEFMGDAVLQLYVSDSFSPISRCSRRNIDNFT